MELDVKIIAASVLPIVMLVCCLWLGYKQYKAAPFYKNNDTIYINNEYISYDEDGTVVLDLPPELLQQLQGGK